MKHEKNFVLISPDKLKILKTIFLRVHLTLSDKKIKLHDEMIHI